MFKKIRKCNPGISLARILYYEFLRRGVQICMVLVAGLRIVGRENLPATGPVLVIANHQSFLDPPLMGAALWRHFFILARSSLFNNLIFDKMIRSVNAIPVRGDQKDAAVFKDCAAHLARGRIVVIYPEGSRSFDGGVDEFKRGVMLLLRRSRAAVLPLAIEGAYDIWPRHQKLPRLGGSVRIKLGKVIPSAELLALDPDEALALMRDRVDTLRLESRAELRVESNGQFPAAGPGDFHHRHPPATIRPAAHDLPSDE